MPDTEIQISEMSDKTWLLPTGKHTVAIGEYELAYVIAGWQRYTQVPRSPRWCHHVFLWQGHLLPLFDLENYLDPAHGNTQGADSVSSDMVAIVLYENQRTETCYGGIRLSAAPAARVVSDDEICDYPPDYPDWEKIALSCFKTTDAGPVPILDIQKLFCSTQLPLPVNNADGQP